MGTVTWINVCSLLQRRCADPSVSLLSSLEHKYLGEIWLSLGVWPPEMMFHNSYSLIDTAELLLDTGAVWLFLLLWPWEPQRRYGHLMSGGISALTLIIKRLVANKMPNELNLCMLERHDDNTSDYLDLTPVNSSVSHRWLNVLVPQ